MKIDQDEITLPEKEFSALEQAIQENSIEENLKLKELLARPTRWAEEENDED